MEGIELTKIIALDSPTASLEAMRMKEEIKAPNSQRQSINTTILRIKDSSKKRFSCKRVNDQYFTIKRIK